jgi:ABC-2 type transport system ATP-binding protein
VEGELLLAEVEPLGPALEALERAPGVLDVAVFGSALHLVVEKAEQSIPNIRDYLVGQSVSVHRLQPIPPTLEDVFVALTTGNSEASTENK